MKVDQEFNWNSFVTFLLLILRPGYEILGQIKQRKETNKQKFENVK